MRAAALLALALGGCLSVPDAKKPMCTSNDDCNTAAGEVCEEHVCYGDPPGGMFAATLAPPNERADELVPLELPVIALPADGWLGDLAFEPAVTYAGRVEAYCLQPDCGARGSLDATITITRPSLFAGGAGFKAVVLSEAGVASGSSFRLALPPTRSGEPAYTLTIVPGGRTMPGSPIPNAAELVPPLRMQLVADGSTAVDLIELGTAKPTIVDGKLTRSDGVPLAGYRVVARGHWDAAAPLDEVSTVAYTNADGAFAVALSDGLAGTVELVATPLADPTAPALHLPGVDATHASTRALVLPAQLGVAKPLVVQITGADGSGKVAPIDGAHVEIVATAATTGTVGAFVTARSEGTTSEGLATVNVYGGGMLAGAYKLRVAPPAGANVGAVFDDALDISTDVTRQLDGRVALAGVALDRDGHPLAGVAVTAHPSPGFVWNLDEAAQQFLAEIPPATTQTDANGAYVLWVDHDLRSAAGAYDLSFEPQGDSRAGRMQTTIVLPSVSTANVTIDPVTIPDAAFVHGRIADLDGLDVEGAELKIFRVDPSASSLCSHVVHAPPSCQVPALIQGRGASDTSGAVRLTLPRP